MEVEASSVPAPEEDLRERILREREAAETERITREKELEEESEQLEKEIEQEIRGLSPKLSHHTFDVQLTCPTEMTEEERTSIFSAPEFLDFVEQSTKIVQRALNDNYDYIRDYTVGAENGMCALSSQLS